MKKVVLVTYPTSFELSEGLALAEAAGYEVKGIVTQRYLNRAKYGMGSGKAEQVAEAVKTHGCDAILFDERLTSVQIYNLAKLAKVEVIDREKLILEIFNLRAKTAEAKLQVQLAELRYEMPRAREKVRLAKMGEQPGFLGLGGYDMDINDRAIRRRMVALNDKLKTISRRRALFRAQRSRMNLPCASLAGYTGAGKTTLFNLLAGEEKEVGRGAFTTLSPSTRAISLFGTKVLILDTVGFISRLPAYMIPAFKATLEELTFSNVLLLVLDGSDGVEDMVKKYRSCVSVLAELGVSPARVIMVFNKADLLSSDEIERKAEALGVEKESSVIVSARTGFGIDRIKAKLFSSVSDPLELTMSLSAEEVIRLSKEIEWLRSNADLKLVRQGDGSISAVINGPSWIVERASRIFQGHDVEPSGLSPGHDEPEGL